MKLPQMIRVNSSNLHSVGHDDFSLFVRFKAKDGLTVYRYPGTIEAMAATIARAESPGRAFNMLVDKTKGEKIPNPYAHTPDTCPSNHWNDGADVCQDCGADLQARNPE